MIPWEKAMGILITLSLNNMSITHADTTNLPHKAPHFGGYDLNTTRHNKVGKVCQFEGKIMGVEYLYIPTTLIPTQL